MSPIEVVVKAVVFSSSSSSLKQVLSYERFEGECYFWLGGVGWEIVCNAMSIFCGLFPLGWILGDFVNFFMNTSDVGLGVFFATEDRGVNLCRCWE